MKHRIWLISRLIVLILLVFVMTVSFVGDSQDKYNKGLSLTKEEYLEGFISFKEELLSAEPYTSYPYSSFVTLGSMLLIVGSYEAFVYLVSFCLRGILTSRNREVILDQKR